MLILRVMMLESNSLEVNLKSANYKLNHSLNFPKTQVFSDIKWEATTASLLEGSVLRSEIMHIED